MEVITIGEVQNAPDHKRNQMILLLRILGLCSMDERFVNNDDGILEPDEVVSLIKLEEFEFSECNSNAYHGLLVVISLGLAFRVIALIALHFMNRDRKI